MVKHSWTLLYHDGRRCLGSCADGYSSGRNGSFDIDTDPGFWLLPCKVTLSKSKDACAQRGLRMLPAGFQSYAGPIEVCGLEDFTCIIGANGAGKSVMVRRQYH